MWLDNGVSIGEHCICAKPSRDWPQAAIPSGSASGRPRKRGPPAAAANASRSAVRLPQHRFKHSITHTFLAVEHLLEPSGPRSRATLSGPGVLAPKRNSSEAQGTTALNSSNFVSSGKDSDMHALKQHIWARGPSKRVRKASAEPRICAKPVQGLAASGHPFPGPSAAISASRTMACSGRKCIPLGQKTNTKDSKQARFKVESSNPLAQRSCRSFHPEPNRPIKSSNETICSSVVQASRQREPQGATVAA